MAVLHLSIYFLWAFCAGKMDLYHGIIWDFNLEKYEAFQKKNGFFTFSGNVNSFGFAPYILFRKEDDIPELAQLKKERNMYAYIFFGSVCLKVILALAF